MEQMISQNIKSTRTATLEDRIKYVRAEIDEQDRHGLRTFSI